MTSEIETTISREDMERLANLAERTGRTVESLLEEALDEFLSRKEQVKD